MYTGLSCISCNEKFESNSNKMEWPQCKHEYCTKCVSNILNENLSLLNQIPKCVYPDCNKLLNIGYCDNDNILKSISYPKKYQITIQYKEYNNMKHLIDGYIRSITFIPNDIISIVFDFYYLNMIKPIKYNEYIQDNVLSDPYIEHMTFSEAVKLNVCDKIDHRDYVGRFVAATIMEKSGMQLKIHYDGWSRKWDIWSNYRSDLQRFAKYKSISNRQSKRFICYKLKKMQNVSINPTLSIYGHKGWRLGEIWRFDNKSGQIQVKYQFDNKYYLYWTHLDNKNEIKVLFPNICFLTLDFKKLCKKQLLCIKCNQYYPKNLIIHWTNCNHIVCIDCLLPFVKDEIIKNKQIPICPEIKCKQELIGQNNISYLYDIWDNKQFNLDYNLKNKLKLLLDRKDKFKCLCCNEWHKNIDLFIKKQINCNHKYSNQCHQIWSSIYDDSECIECCSKCEICQIYSKNKYLIKWTLCGHKYHAKCAKKYFSEWIHKTPSIFNEIIISNNNNLIPLCIHKDCDQFLDVLCAKKLGITEYQYQTLYYLRKENILTENNDDDEFFFPYSVKCR